MVLEPDTVILRPKTGEISDCSAILFQVAQFWHDKSKKVGAEETMSG